MSKAVYIGSSNLARKLSKCYVGDGNNLSRKAKKLYIGDANGLAKLGWSTLRRLVKSAVSPTPTLNYYCYMGATASIGDYALFAGGRGNSSGSSPFSTLSSVTAYNKSLTKSSPTDLVTPSYQLAGASQGTYALFGGGYDSTSVNFVSAYNASLTRSTPTRLSLARCRLSAVANVPYVLFGGGENNTDSVVDAYNASLTRTVPTALSAYRYNMGVASVGDYALFCGGYPLTATIDTYNKSLTRSNNVALSLAKQRIAGTTVGGKAVIGLGQTSTGDSGLSYSADVFNVSLTRTVINFPNVVSGRAQANSVGDCALFVCLTTNVACCDESLTITTPSGLSSAPSYDLPMVGAVGNYVLVGGGAGGSQRYPTPRNTIEVYQAFAF